MAPRMSSFRRVIRPMLQIIHFETRERPFDVGGRHVFNCSWLVVNHFRSSISTAGSRDSNSVVSAHNEVISVTFFNAIEFYKD
jgi:hypothetical protein